MNRIELKELAKRQINPYLGIIFLQYIIIFLIIIASSYIAAPISYIFGVILELSLFSVYLNISQDIPPSVKNLFDIFKNGRLCGNGILLYLMISIFSFLWSLLFIVPGIIKSLSYSMAPYILIENDYYMTPMDAIRESQRIMQGHKMELFVLYLSFIGWYLLSFITCGLVMFYVDPYINMTVVNFYNRIKDSSDITE